MMMNKKISLIMNLMLIIFCLVFACDPELGFPRLLVADFESGEATSNLGGTITTWQTSSTSVELSFSATGGEYGDTALAVQLQGNDGTGAEGWSGGGLILGITDKAEGLDLTPYNALEFSLKLLPGHELAAIRIKLEDTSGQPTLERELARYAELITGAWQSIVIPLEEFAALQPQDPDFRFPTDLSGVTTIVTVAANDGQPGSSGNGIFLIDEVMFTSRELSALTPAPTPAITPANPTPLLVADFESGVDFTLCGGAITTWQHNLESVEYTHASGAGEYFDNALQILTTGNSWSTPPPDNWSGGGISLNMSPDGTGMDLTAFNTLELRIKRNYFQEDLQIKLEDTREGGRPERLIRRYDTNFSGWVHVVIPLTEFTTLKAEDPAWWEPLDLTQVKSITTLSIHNDMGIVCVDCEYFIDELMFTARNN